MIKNNNFYIENLNSVVFLGQSDVFSKLIKINNSLKLNTLIITSSHQAKLIDKKIDYKIFDKLDDKFNDFIDKNIKVKNTIFVSLGARYILDTGMTNRFAVGLDFKYSHTAIKKIKDPKDITPINAFTIQTAGIYATASVFFGGRRTKGDTGKMHYYTGDYITSKRFLEEFVDENPNHANIARAKKLAVESERRIPYQLMREGMSFD